MKKILIGLSLFLITSSMSFAKSKNPIVVMNTSKGAIEIELFEKKAPASVKNFLKYVDDKFYNGTIFHRVIDSFMIQGGGFTDNLKKKKTRAPIANEAHNRISNDIGTLAMARTSDINSATAQFFINVKHNSFLDHKGKNPSGYGYAVFGKVVKGMSIVNQIKKVGITANGPFKNLPVENIVIKSVIRKK